MLRKKSFYLAILSLLLFFQVQAGFAQTEQVKHTDDFSSSTLDPAWSWVREEKSLWSLTEKPGFLRITSMGIDLWEGGKVPNILVRAIPYSNFSAVCKVSCDPKIAYQQAGLVVYQDERNCVKSCYGTDGMIDMDVCKQIDGKPDGQHLHIIKMIYKMTKTGLVQTPVISGFDAVYIKITKTGNNYSLYHSFDNKDWKFEMTYKDVNLVNPKIGLVCQNIAGMNAYFDWFDITPQ